MLPVTLAPDVRRQVLHYLGATFNVNGVIALVLVLAALGVAIVRVMTWLERRLLHWQ